MKFLVVCMFALVASSLGGDAKKEKRGLLGLNGHSDAALTEAQFHQELPANNLVHNEAAYAFPLAEQHAPLTHAEQAAPSAQAAPSLQAASFAYANHYANQHANQLASEPLSHHEERITSEHTHTHTVERINVPVPYPVDRTVVKHVPVDRPVPQPYPVEVIKKVPQPVYIDRPYPVHVKVAVPKPYAVPVDRVQTVVQHVPVPTPVDRPIPQPYPVYLQQHQQPAVAVEQRAFGPSFAFQQPAFSTFSANGQNEQQSALLSAEFQPQGHAYAAPSLAAQSFSAQHLVTHNFEAQPWASPNAAILTHAQAVPAGAW